MRVIIAFQKKEQVRHIGHLDVQRAARRALRRGNIPVRYSEGFNPHAVLSFASPLPVGVSGDYELMELALAVDCGPDEILEKMKGTMPPSLPVFAAKAVLDSHPKLMAMLKTAEYRAAFEATPDTLQMAGAMEAFLRQREIVALRKTKSGESPCDIRPMIHQLRAEIDDQIVAIDFRVSLMEKETLKPDLLLEMLAKHAGVALPSYRLRRLRLLTERDGQPVNLMER